MSSSITFKLGQEATVSLKQNQRLMMSPQMQQAIHLLQMPILELSTMIDVELEQNPILEKEEDVIDTAQEEREHDAEEPQLDADMPAEKEIVFDDRNFEIMRQLDEDFRDHFAESAPVHTPSPEERFRNFIENTLQGRPSLFETLMSQAREIFTKKEEQRAAEAVIGNLDHRGFLTTPLLEIALIFNIELKILEGILHSIQTFSPFGVGAANLRESLLIQLRCLGRENSVAYQIVDKHYDDMLHNRIPCIQKSLKQSNQVISHALQQEIAKLDFQPGSICSHELTQAIVPDLIVYDEGEILSIDTNNDALPTLRVNHKYLKMLSDRSLPRETKEYIEQKLSSGKWLLRNIHQRNETLLRIGHHLLTHQKDFLLSAQGQLKPMTMKTLAQELQLHESTIARAIANKYISCPRGMLPLRAFFTNAYVTEEGAGLSSHTVKELLKELIDKEDKQHPLSDEALSTLFKQRGIECARRTIAKYRNELNIGNAGQRRLY
jgi:RNA polymerase sigma-54 factor